jgi:hypothetical protein
MKRLTSILVVVLALTLAQLTIFGQTTSGRLTGSVAGADGAVIPGASVVVIDKKTARQLTSTTNGEGSFAFANLDVGEYSVKVTAQGFKTTTTNIKIETGQEYSLPVTVEVGAITENVTITAGADVINSSNAELTSTLSNRQITELPLAGRNPLGLITTQPGSASSPNQGTSINGGRTSSTNITRDGVNINDNFIRANATDFSSSRLSVDNVEEFTLSSQSAVDAGFGSAQVSFVTPRGGNEFHGGVWEYNRNSKFAANSFFNKAGGRFVATDAQVISGAKQVGDERNPRPFRNRNQYGFKFSGPMLKNKLFFFVFGEKLNDIVFANKLTTVLTASARQGIFRYQDGATIRSTNIFCAGCFITGASGVAAPNAINPVINSTFLANMPVGNSVEAGDQLNTTGYRFSQQGNVARKAMTGRVDYDLNDKNNINAVIDYNREETLRTDLGGTTATPLVTQPARNVQYAGGWRSTFTSNLSNELRMGQLYSAPEFFRTDDPVSEYYLPTLITNPGPLNGAAVFRYQGRLVKTRNVQDTMSWLHGNHAFRFGAQYQSVKITAFNDAGISPVYALGINTTIPTGSSLQYGPNLQAATLATAAGGGALSTAQQTAARNLYALLGGVINSGTQTFNVSSQSSGFVPNFTSLRPFAFSMIAPYVLDQWKITPTLTLNVGLRYDYQKPLELENGLLFEPTIADGRDPVEAILDPAGTFQFIGGNAGKANSFYKKDTNNWAPSFGFAWAPRELGNGFLKTVLGEGFVVRGGYRRSYVNDELVTAPNNALAGLPGFSSAVNAVSPIGTTGLDDRVGVSHASTLATPVFVTSRNYTTNNTAAAGGNLGTVFGVDPNLQTPNQNDYQIGIQRQFGSWAAEARYVGGYSKNMLRTIDYGQVRIPSAYRADFDRVRLNVLAGCATTAACAAGAPLFLQMGNNGGVVSGANFSALNAFGNLVLTGQIAELAWQQLGTPANGIPNPNVTPYPGTTTGALRAQFLANPNAGVVNLLQNGGHYNYNALQLELRRRFEKGLYVQANYTFSKELTDAIGTGQTRVEPFLDNNNTGLDYTRADYDQTHVINVNGIYELPFGRGRQFLNSNRWLDYVIGGWQLGTIVRIASGSPVTFTDARGTLNRAARAGRQTALTNLSDSELKDLIGIFNTPCGIYYVNPTAININQANLAAGNCSALNQGLPTGTIPGTSVVTSTTGGVGSNGFGFPTFAGQAFFSNGPGQTGTLRRAIVNGPWLVSADLSLAKNFAITERASLQIRGEAYNFTNTPFFNPGQFLDINSTSFGRTTSVAVGARVVQLAARLTF